MYKEQTEMPHQKHGILSRAILIIAIALCILSIAASTASAEIDQNKQLKIKAAYIYNFINFVEWPDEENNERKIITLYIIGSNSFGSFFDPIKKRTIRGKKFVVRHCLATDTVIPGSVVFVSATQENRLKAIINSLSNKNILTISDINDFIHKGGIIGLHEKDESIRFSISMNNANTAKLKISSKLLELAEIVEK